MAEAPPIQPRRSKKYTSDYLVPISQNCNSKSLKERKAEARQYRPLPVFEAEDDPPALPPKKIGRAPIAKELVCAPHLHQINPAPPARLRSESNERSATDSSYVPAEFLMRSSIPSQSGDETSEVYAVINKRRPVVPERKSIKQHKRSHSDEVLDQSTLNVPEIVLSTSEGVKSTHSSLEYLQLLCPSSNGVSSVQAKSLPNLLDESQTPDMKTRLSSSSCSDIVDENGADNGKKKALNYVKLEFPSCRPLDVPPPLPKKNRSTIYAEIIPVTLPPFPHDEQKDKESDYEELNTMTSMMTPREEGHRVGKILTSESDVADLNSESKSESLYVLEVNPNRKEEPIVTPPALPEKERVQKPLICEPGLNSIIDVFKLDVNGVPIRNPGSDDDEDDIQYVAVRPKTEVKRRLPDDFVSSTKVGDPVPPIPPREHRNKNVQKVDDNHTEFIDLRTLDLPSVPLKSKKMVPHAEEFIDIRTLDLPSVPLKSNKIVPHADEFIDIRTLDLPSVPLKSKKLEQKVTEFLDPATLRDLPPSVPSRSSRKGKKSKMDQNLQLFQHSWFHGKISQEDAVLSLWTRGKPCDFLIRESTNRCGQFTLSIRMEESIWHIPIHTMPTGGYLFRALYAPTLNDLVVHLQNNVFQCMRKPIKLAQPLKYLLNSEDYLVQCSIRQ